MSNSDKEMATIPYFVHEGAMIIWQKNFRFVLITLIVTIILLFATNVMWALYWYQFDTMAEEITMEADGGDANYIGHNGDISYGEDQDQET